MVTGKVTALRRRLASELGRFGAQWVLRDRLLVVTDRAGWILDNVSERLGASLPGGFRARVVGMEWTRARNCLVHLISRSWIDLDEAELAQAADGNALIAVWWHGGIDSSDPGLRENLKRLAHLRRLFVRVHAPCHSSATALRDAGVEAGRIVVIPEGTDVTRFAVGAKWDRESLRARMGVPAGAIAIGSFQKDGVGWGNGDEPKLVKGPDILADALALVSKAHCVAAVIPGPSRGYLVRRLQQAGVPYIAPGYIPAAELARWYQALDVYVSPSREEGGPAGVIEALAAGVPVVSTRTGVAPDVMTDGGEGFITEIDPVRLAEAIACLAGDARKRAECSTLARHTGSRLDWNRLASRYVEELYRPAMQETGMHLEKQKS